MSVSSLCQVCEAARADHSCQRCGSFVCERHYDRELGACADCARGGGWSEGPQI